MRDLIFEQGGKRHQDPGALGIKFKGAVALVAAARKVQVPPAVRNADQIADAAKAAGEAPHPRVGIHGAGLIQSAQNSRHGDGVSEPAEEAGKRTGFGQFHFKFSRRLRDPKGNPSRDGEGSRRPGEGSEPVQ